MNTNDQIFRAVRDCQSGKFAAARRDGSSQPFHLDEEAASKSILAGLAASGWHTAAMTMRLLVESDLKPDGGIIGRLRRIPLAAATSPER